MADQPYLDDLAQLRAELAAQRAMTVAQQARLTRLERRGRVPSRALTLALVALLMALMPLSLLAADPVFSDLNEAAAVHRPNIQAIGNVGITTGFADPNDPTKRTYNPNGLVTREEMASFLARTAGLGGNPPVANARTAVTAGSATTAGTATNATTATSADHATSANTASSAIHATTADIATNATTAGNATTVGGYTANALTRISFASAELTNIVPMNAYTAVGEVTITVPGSVSQAVAVRGKINLRGQPSGGEIQTLISPASGNGTFSRGSIFPYLNNSIGTGIMVYDDWVFIVSPGTYTYQLLVLNSSTSGPLYTNFLTMTAITYPFGSDGTAGMTEITPSQQP